MKKSEFVEKLKPYVTECVRKYGYNDIITRAIISQAACESAWGESSLAKKYNNYFGMKCGSKWSGKSVNFKTKEEYTPGTLTTIKDNFRAYDSLEEGIAGYFDFIKMKRYAPLKKCTTPEMYFQTLKACGWATSSAYVKTLTDIYYGLYGNSTEAAESEAEKIEKMAREVIEGKYGNGARRRAALGVYYRAVQDRVNKILRG